MPDLNDFYVFKTTSSDKGYSRCNNNQNSGSSGGMSCSSAFVALMIKDTVQITTAKHRHHGKICPNSCDLKTNTRCT